MHYWHSPTIVIDEYIGDPHGELSPEWLETVQPECRFWQSRTVMLEMMLYFVQTIPHNSSVLKRVADWCSAMTVNKSHSLNLKTNLTKYSKVPASTLSYLHLKPCSNLGSPRNTRLHKPRVSDLSDEESQKLRKALNMGSPLRKRGRSHPNLHKGVDLNIRKWEALGRCT